MFGIEIPRNGTLNGSMVFGEEAWWRTTQTGLWPRLFSLGPRLPQFIERFPDAKILYMVRDPVSVIPLVSAWSQVSLTKGLDLVTPEADRKRYCHRLYQALVELLRRFHEDWTSGKISKSHVFIVPFPRLMNDFEGLMGELLDFTDHKPDAALLERIAKQAEKQRAYQSKHRYDLLKFGLTEAQIRQDCAFVYDTFLGDETPHSDAQFYLTSFLLSCQSKPSPHDRDVSVVRHRIGATLSLQTEQAMQLTVDIRQAEEEWSITEDEPSEVHTISWDCFLMRWLDTELAATALNVRGA